MISPQSVSFRRISVTLALSAFIAAATLPSGIASTRHYHHHYSRASYSRTTHALPSRGGGDVAPPSAAAAPVVVGRLGVVTDDNVEITAGREDYGRLLSRVSKGSNLTITGQTDDYYAVMMIDHSTGFVSKDKVQLLDYEITANATNAGTASGPLGQALVQSAMQYSGVVPYLWGGNTMDGIDCSGFVKAVYASNGIQLPRTAADQANVGYDVPKADTSKWQVGDRMYFQCHHDYIDHTGMYIGNGYFIHSHAGPGVSVTRIDQPFYWAHLVAIRRSVELLNDAQPGAVSAPDTELSQAN